MTKDNFWTDELVKEFAIGFIHFESSKKQIEKFKQSKLQSQDKQVGWEIVEFVTPFLGSNDVHFTRSNAGMFCTGLNGKFYEYTEERMIEEKRPIHSVRRLSDNEVFTIGDKITWGIHKDWESELTGFEIIEDRLKFYDSKLPQGRRPTDFVNALNLSKIMPPQPSSIDRIEVNWKSTNTPSFKIEGGFPVSNERVHSFFTNGLDIPKDKFPLIKQSIEDAINGKEEGKIYDEFNAPPMYTQSAVDTIRRETWHACREWANGMWSNQLFPIGGNSQFKYPFIEDYLKSLSTPTTQPKEEDKPVFKTHDGVEIQKAHDYWFLNPYTFTYWKADHNRLFTNDSWLTFSTEQAAKDWLLENKPCLSLKEIMDEIRRHCDGSYSNDFQDWDLPRKADEIINPLAEIIAQKQTKQ